MSRIRGLLSAASTALELAVEDPVWLTVQAGRRLPGPMRRRLGEMVLDHTRRPTLRAWGHLLQDQLDAARRELPVRPSGHALDASLRVHVGLAPDPGRSPAAAARAAWLTGDLTALESVRDNPAAPATARITARDNLELVTGRARPVPHLEPLTAGGAASALPGDRVVHVLTNSLPWTRSGYTLRTHAILTTQRRMGLDVVAITRPGYPAAIGRPWFRGCDEIDAVPYHRVAPLRLPPGDAARVDLWARQIAGLAARHHATVLHTTTHYPNALATEAAAAALGLPWVYEVRGQLERTWAAGRVAAGDADPLGSRRYHEWRDAESAVAARADAVVTISQALADDLIDRGVSPGRITLVPNGIDGHVLQESRSSAEVRAGLGLSTDGFWVGAVTSVVHYEGLDTLVAAIAQARSTGRDIRGAIVGDGVAWPALAQLVHALGLNDVIRLPGRLPQDQARTWLAGLDAVAIPRLDHEVTRNVPPLKLMEALGIGRPVIVSGLPAMTEVVRHSSSGLLVPPDDPDRLAQALITLAEDAELREELTARGRQVATAHTWDALVKNHADIYKRLHAHG